MKYILIPSATADIEVSNEERIFPRDWDIIAGEWLISHDIFVDIVPGTGNCWRCSRFGRLGGFCNACDALILPIITQQDVGLRRQPMQFNPVLIQELFPDPNLLMEWMRPTTYHLGLGEGLPVYQVHNATQNIQPGRAAYRKTMDILISGKFSAVPLGPMIGLITLCQGSVSVVQPIYESEHTVEYGQGSSEEEEMSWGDEDY